MKRNKRLWASEFVPWACSFTKKGTLRKGITTSCIGIATIPKTLFLGSEPAYHDGNYEHEFLLSLGGIIGRNNINAT